MRDGVCGRVGFPSPYHKDLIICVHTPVYKSFSCIHQVYLHQSVSEPLKVI